MISWFKAAKANQRWQHHFVCILPFFCSWRGSELVTNSRKWQKYNVWTVVAAGGESVPQPCLSEDRRKLDPRVGLFLLHWEDCIKSKTQTWVPFLLTVPMRALLGHKLWYISHLFAFLFVCRPQTSAVPSLVEHQRLFSELAPSQSLSTAHAVGFWHFLSLLPCC